MDLFQRFHIRLKDALKKECDSLHETPAQDLLEYNKRIGKINAMKDVLVMYEEAFRTDYSEDEV